MTALPPSVGNNPNRTLIRYQKTTNGTPPNERTCPNGTHLAKFYATSLLRYQLPITRLLPVYDYSYTAGWMTSWLKSHQQQRASPFSKAPRVFYGYRRYFSAIKTVVGSRLLPNSIYDQGQEHVPVPTLIHATS